MSDSDFLEKLKIVNSQISAASIEVRGNKLWLRGTFPPKPGSEQKFPHRQKFSLGYSADLKGLRAAEPRARLIASKLQLGQFDWLEVLPEKIKPAPEVTLQELWEKYERFKSGFLAPNTINVDYGRYKRLIEQMPTKSPDDAIKIRDWATANLVPVTAKRLIVNLSACCDWCVKSDLLEKNLFKGLADDIRVPTAARADRKPQPFTAQERDLIIAGFQNSDKYRYYADFVAFLFFSGCRPSEAIALRWQHVGERVITFSEASYIDSVTKVRTGLKTQSSRQFPINNQLHDILMGARQRSKCLPGNLVFPGRNGKLISLGKFSCHAWRGYTNRHGHFIPGIVTETLGMTGYRSPYSCRHTFINLCLEAGIDAKDVAEWVGNTPEVIYRNYAAANKNQVVPEI